MQYSILTLYTGVVLMIANLLRKAFFGKVNHAIYSEIPDSKPLLQLCDSI